MLSMSGKEITTCETLEGTGKTVFTRGRGAVRRNGVTFELAQQMVSPVVTTADQVQYIYDDLGRLSQVIDGQGNVATYNYDAVGNLLSIMRNMGGVGALSITARPSAQRDRPRPRARLRCSSRSATCARTCGSSRRRANIAACTAADCRLN